MRTRTSLAVVSLLFSLAPAPLYGAAARPTGTPPPPLQPTNLRQQSRAEAMPKFSVEFPGGTIADYVSAVKSAARSQNAALNVVIPADAARVPMPSISLEAVGVETAMNAIEAAFRQHPEHAFKIDAFQQDPQDLPSFAVVYQRLNPSASAGMGSAPRPSIEVFSVRDLVPTDDPDLGPPVVVAELIDRARRRLLSAIESTLEVQDRFASAHGEKSDASNTSVNFHAESDLLIVHGSPGTIDIIRSVLSQIRKDAASQRAEASQRAQRQAAHNHRVADARAKLDLCELELATARSRFERIDKLNAAGNVDQDQFESARHAVSRAQIIRDQARAELEYIHEINVAPVPPALRDRPLTGPGPDDASEPHLTVAYPLAHAPATDVLPLIAAILNALGAPNDLGEARNTASVATNMQTNSIIVRARADTQRLVRLTVDTVNTLTNPAQDRPPAPASKPAK